MSRLDHKLVIIRRPLSIRGRAYPLVENSGVFMSGNITYFMMDGMLSGYEGQFYKDLIKIDFADIISNTAGMYRGWEEWV